MQFDPLLAGHLAFKENLVFLKLFLPNLAPNTT
jgi:hypothetical protein